MIFNDFQREIKALSVLPNLRSLYVNLEDEPQVDIIMKTLEELEFLNGLPVEREYLEEADSFGTDEDFKKDPDIASSIREVPEEESNASSDNIQRADKS